MVSARRQHWPTEFTNSCLIYLCLCQSKSYAGIST